MFDTELKEKYSDKAKVILEAIDGMPAGDAKEVLEWCNEYVSWGAVFDLNGAIERQADR